MTPRPLSGLLARLTLTALISLFASACGGGSSATQPGRSADDEAESDLGSSESGGTDADEATEDEPPPAQSRISCDDGTCTKCGDALCLAGMYCDESAKGGPACGWLPECVARATCACVTKTLSACSCEERGGGLYISCK